MKKRHLFITSTLLALALMLALSPLGLAQEKTYVIGIAQFAEHPSLDNCREGFIQGLAEQGFIEGKNVTFVVQNAQQDMGLAQQIASQMAETVDLVCAIATPMAQAAFNACMDKDIPVIYNAVSDPVAAMLANADGMNDKAVTGTSDLLPVEAQLAMIRALLPAAEKIGILYTTSETNSESQLKTYQEKASSFGFEIIPMGVSTGADIPLAMDSLLPKVDCLTNLTDNTVVSNLPVILDKANAAKKAVFGSEIEQVKNGCVASVGVEYMNLGIITGQLAAQVLEGQFAGSIPFALCTESSMYYNSAVAEALEIPLPADALSQATDVTTLPAE